MKLRLYLALSLSKRTRNNFFHRKMKLGKLKQLLYHKGKPKHIDRFTTFNNKTVSGGTETKHGDIDEFAPVLTVKPKRLFSDGEDIDLDPDIKAYLRKEHFEETKLIGTTFEIKSGDANVDDDNKWSTCSELSDRISTGIQMWFFDKDRHSHRRKFVGDVYHEDDGSSVSSLSLGLTLDTYDCNIDMHIKVGNKQCDTCFLNWGHSKEQSNVSQRSGNDHFVGENKNICHYRVNSEVSDVNTTYPKKQRFGVDKRNFHFSGLPKSNYIGNNRQMNNFQTRTVKKIKRYFFSQHDRI